MNKKVLSIMVVLLFFVGVGSGFGLAQLMRGSSTGSEIIDMPSVLGMVWDSHAQCERCMLNVYLKDLHDASEVKAFVDAAFDGEDPGIYIRKANTMADLQVKYSVDDLYKWRNAIQGPLSERVSSLTLLSTDQNSGRIIIGVRDLSVAPEVEEVLSALGVPVGVLALLESSGITLTAQSLE